MSKEAVLNQVSELLDATEVYINGILAGTSPRLGITALANKLSNELGMNKNFTYALIADYVFNRNDITTVQGPGNGIMSVVEANARAAKTKERSEKVKNRKPSTTQSKPQNVLDDLAKDMADAEF